MDGIGKVLPQCRTCSHSSNAHAWNQHTSMCAVLRTSQGSDSAAEDLKHIHKASEASCLAIRSVEWGDAFKPHNAFVKKMRCSLADTSEQRGVRWIGAVSYLNNLMGKMDTDSEQRHSHTIPPLTNGQAPKD
eukprot:6472316-Amphidinium_carterae.2